MQHGFSSPGAASISGALHTREAIEVCKWNASSVCPRASGESVGGRSPAAFWNKWCSRLQKSRAKAVEQQRQATRKVKGEGGYLRPMDYAYHIPMAFMLQLDAETTLKVEAQMLVDHVVLLLLQMWQLMNMSTR